MSANRVVIVVCLAILGSALAAGIALCGICAFGIGGPL